jgi:hypothetical protein
VEHIRIREFSAPVAQEFFPYFVPGLQTQSATSPLYKGPLDAVRKIYGAHGIVGIYKGQAVTFLREATGYGVYFLTYEKLVEREMKKRGIQRNEINLGMSIAYGAAAGYAVRAVKLRALLLLEINSTFAAMGCDIPDRHDKISDANRRVYQHFRPKI